VNDGIVGYNSPLAEVQVDFHGGSKGKGKELDVSPRPTAMVVENPHQDYQNTMHRTSVRSSHITQNFEPQHRASPATKTQNFVAHGAFEELQVGEGEKNSRLSTHKCVCKDVPVEARPELQLKSVIRTGPSLPKSSLNDSPLPSIDLQLSNSTYKNHVCIVPITCTPTDRFCSQRKENSNAMSMCGKMVRRAENLIC